MRLLCAFARIERPRRCVVLRLKGEDVGSGPRPMLLVWAIWPQFTRFAMCPPVSDLCVPYGRVPHNGAGR
eukprot:3269415-Prymnesium_polylepis.2